MSKQSKISKIEQGFRLIASQFVEDETVIRDGQQVKRNKFQWLQKSVLNSLVNSFDYQVEFTENRLAEQKDRVAKEARADNGTEINVRELNRAINFAQLIEAQLEVLSAARRDARDAFSTIFGENYVRFGTRTSRPAAGTEDAVVEALRRAEAMLGKKLPNRMNGVEVAGSEAG